MDLLDSCPLISVLFDSLSEYSTKENNLLSAYICQQRSYEIATVLRSIKRQVLYSII